MRRGGKGAWLVALALAAVCLAGALLWRLAGGGGAPGPQGASAPEPVPILVARPGPADGQGRVALRPPGPFRAGSEADFEIDYTVGDPGVAPAGFVILQVSPWWGWSPPQVRDPARPGFTDVKTSSSDPPRVVRELPLNRVQVVPGRGGFRPGDTVTFRYGGARVDRFAEDEEFFQVFVDADGDGHGAPVEPSPAVRIVAGATARLNVTVGSQAVPGGVVEVRVVPLDALGNWGELPGGRYELLAVRDGHPLERLEQREPGGSQGLSFRYALAREGVYFFHASGPAGLSGRSNVLLCQQGVPRLQRYFGDIHGHSRLSDGTGTPEAFFRYAREVSGLDIAALTDHSDYGTVDLRGAAWERLQEAADRANDPGRFVTFAGFEWTSWVYGHRNVYYRDGKGPLLRPVDPESDTPEELWKLLEPYEAMTVAHHVGGGPMATDWDVAPGPKEWLVEICSVHGSSEAWDGRSRIYRPVAGRFVQDALRRGYRLGIMGSGDTHDGHPGQRSAGAVTGGLLAVYSPELTREAVWEAFRERRVYATSGPKILLNFQAAGRPMGSRLTWSRDAGQLPLAVRAVGCDPITEVVVLRDGNRVFVWEGMEEQVLLLREDSVPAGAAGCVYTVRVTQRDGHMAWSSPVWVDVR